MDTEVLHCSAQTRHPCVSVSLVAEPDTSCFPLLLSEMSTEESSDQSKV